MRPSTTKLRVELLEKREMLSVTAVLNGGTLAITGDSQPNTIRVTQDAAAVQWSVVGDNVNLGVFSNVNNITINPKNGPDVVAVQGTQLPGSLTITGGIVGVAATVSGVIGTPSRPAVPLTITGSLMITGGVGPDVVQLRSVAAKSAIVLLASGNDQLYIASAGQDAGGATLFGLNADAVAILMGGGDDLVSVGAAVNASSFARIDGGSNTTTSPGDTISGTANVHGPAGSQAWVNFETIDPSSPSVKAILGRPTWMIA